MAKPWWLSKTMWFNFVMALVTFANEMLPLLDHIAQLGAPAEHVAITRTVLTMVVIIGNSILRTVTSKPLAVR